jgi:hypothetical protein
VRVQGRGAPNRASATVVDDLSEVAGLSMSPQTPLVKSPPREGDDGVDVGPRDIYYGLRIDEALALDSDDEDDVRFWCEGVGVGVGAGGG